MMNMMKKVMMITATLCASAMPALAETLCVGESAETSIDLATGTTRIAGATEKLAYSTEWDGGDAVTLAANDVTLASGLTGSDTYEWAPSGVGAFELKHTVETSGGEVVLTANFIVQSVSFSPTAVDEATLEVYANGVKVEKTGEEYLLPSNATASVVYTATNEDYAFSNGTREMSVALDTGVNPATVAGEVPAAPVQVWFGEAAFRYDTSYKTNEQGYATYYITQTNQVLPIAYSTNNWGKLLDGVTVSLLYEGPDGVATTLVDKATANGLYDWVLKEGDLGRHGFGAKSENGDNQVNWLDGVVYYTTNFNLTVTQPEHGAIAAYTNLIDAATEVGNDSWPLALADEIKLVTTPESELWWVEWVATNGVIFAEPAQAGVAGAVTNSFAMPFADAAVTAKMRYVGVELQSNAVAHASAKFYTNGVEVAATGDKYIAATNTQAYVVYEAQGDYYFNGSKKVITNELDTSVNPATTVGGLPAVLEPVKYTKPVYVDNIASNGIAYWTTNTIYGYTIVVDDMTEWNEGWYAVKGLVSMSDRIECKGAVNLLLCDGGDLTASCGIEVAEDEGAELSIYVPLEGAGTLVAVGDHDGAGIGSSEANGPITINGGTINATGCDESAGIGGGEGGEGKNITINGGTVTATGGEGGAGIGGGDGGEGKNITINGGMVTTTGGECSAAIGGGEGGEGNNITINGGVVTATGGQSGAAIGGGSYCDGQNITINGGTVTVNGGSDASGIGGGESGNGNNITISGGTVTVTGGQYGAAIGGGSYCDGQNITVNGGTVTVNGGFYGAAIGGGWYGQGSDITIRDATVFAIACGSLLYGEYTYPNFIGNGASCEDVSTGNTIEASAKVMFNLTGLIEGYSTEWTEEPAANPKDFKGFVIMTPETQTVDRVLVGSVANWAAATTFTLTNAVTGATSNITVNAEERTIFANTFLDLKNTDGSLKLAANPLPLLTVKQQPNVQNDYTILAKTDGNEGITNYAWGVLQPGSDVNAQTIKVIVEGETLTTFPMDLGEVGTNYVCRMTYGHNGEFYTGDSEVFTFHRASIAKPAVVPNVTAKVYTNGVLSAETTVGSGEWNVWSNEAAYVVYEADGEYYLDGNVKAITNELDTSVMPATTVGVLPKVLEPVEYTKPVYVGNVASNGIAYWTTNKVYGYTVVKSSASRVTWGTAGATNWYVVTNGTYQIDGGVVCAGHVNLVLCDGAKLTVPPAKEFYAGIQTDAAGSFTIYGQPDGAGELSATGGGSAAGIGGGQYDNGQNITINGGSVTATGGEYGAGIGGGDRGNGQNITINGGTIMATSGISAAGIGGGYMGAGSNITIREATVFVCACSDLYNGGYYSPDVIGNGEDCEDVSTGNTIDDSAKVFFNLTGVYDYDKEGLIEEIAPMPETFEGFVIMTPETQTVDRVLVGGVENWVGATTFILTNAVTGATTNLTVNDTGVIFTDKLLSLPVADGKLTLKANDYSIINTPIAVENVTAKVYTNVVDDTTIVATPAIIVKDSPAYVVYETQDEYCFADGTTAITNQYDTSVVPATVVKAPKTIVMWEDEREIPFDTRERILVKSPSEVLPISLYTNLWTEIGGEKSTLSLTISNEVTGASEKIVDIVKPNIRDLGYLIDWQPEEGEYAPYKLTYEISNVDGQKATTNATIYYTFDVPLTIVQSVGGTVTVTNLTKTLTSGDNVMAYDVVNAEVKPYVDETIHFEVVSVAVTNNTDGSTVKLDHSGENYTFEMPTNAATLDVQFKIQKIFTEQKIVYPGESWEPLPDETYDTGIINMGRLILRGEIGDVSITNTVCGTNVWDYTMKKQPRLNRYDRFVNKGGILEILVDEVITNGVYEIAENAADVEGKGTFVVHNTNTQETVEMNVDDPKPEDDADVLGEHSYVLSRDGDRIVMTVGDGISALINGGGYTDKRLTPKKTNDAFEYIEKAMIEDPDELFTIDFIRKHTNEGRTYQPGTHLEAIANTYVINVSNETEVIEAGSVNDTMVIYEGDGKVRFDNGAIIWASTNASSEAYTQVAVFNDATITNTLIVGKDVDGAAETGKAILYLFGEATTISPDSQIVVMPNGIVKVSNEIDIGRIVAPKGYEIFWYMEDLEFGVPINVFEAKRLAAGTMYVDEPYVLSDSNLETANALAENMYFVCPDSTVSNYLVKSSVKMAEYQSLFDCKVTPNSETEFMLESYLTEAAKAEIKAALDTASAKLLEPEVRSLGAVTIDTKPGIFYAVFEGNDPTTATQISDWIGGEGGEMYLRFTVPAANGKEFFTIRAATSVTEE